MIYQTEEVDRMPRCASLRSASQLFRRALIPMGLVIAINAYGAELHFDSDRMAVINGQRTFVLGLYEMFDDPAVYDTVAKAGFNIVHAPASTDVLNQIKSRGLFAWIQTGGLIDLGDDRANRETQLKSLVDQFGSHPALLTWEVPDEALWNTWYAPVQWRMLDEPLQLTTLSSGKNSKRVSSETRNRIDRLKKLYAAGEYEEGEKEADAIWKSLGKEQPHPELSIGNSAANVEKLRAGMVEGYRYLKSIDADNSVWMNHAPRNQIATLAAFNKGADIVGCDMYPAPSFGHDHSDIADQTLSAVGAYTDRMQLASPNKPVWMVLQAFGWEDILKSEGAINHARHRRPEPHELRFMAYDAIVHGARGVLYWGTTLIEKPSKLWTDILALVRELADLQPVLSAPAAAIRPVVSVGETWGSVDRTVQIMAKDVDGQVALIIVNEWNERLDYRVSGLEAIEGQSFSDASEKRQVTVASGEIKSTIRAYGVHVLQPVKSSD